MTAAISTLADALEGLSNKHEKAILLIHACIDEGTDTHGRIVQALVAVGLDYQHVGIVLHKNCGPSAERHHWRKVSDQYLNHPGCCS